MEREIKQANIYHTNRLTQATPSEDVLYVIIKKNLIHQGLYLLFYGAVS